jgi:hypothetical protein
VPYVPAPVPCDGDCGFYVAQPGGTTCSVCIEDREAAQRLAAAS